MTTAIPDLSKVEPWVPDMLASSEVHDDIVGMLDEARDFLEFYDWCSAILAEYVGFVYPGIVGVFLFKIKPSKPGVDEWIWVIVGDLPPAYLTCDGCRNPAAALDGYIGAMNEWVEAAEAGKSVKNLVPVNVPASPKNADMLKVRLKFLDENILSEYQDDLRDH